MKSQWTIGIGTTLFGFILTVVYDVVKQKNIFSTILSLLNWIWKGLIAILTFEVKIWWLLVFVAFIIGIMYLYLSLIKKKDASKPAFLEYTHDRLKEWNEYYQRLGANIDKIEIKQMKQLFARFS